MDYDEIWRIDRVDLILGLGLGLAHLLLAGNDAVAEIYTVHPTECLLVL